MRTFTAIVNELAAATTIEAVEVLTQELAARSVVEFGGPGEDANEILVFMLERVRVLRAEVEVVEAIEAAAAAIGR